MITPTTLVEINHVGWHPKTGELYVLVRNVGSPVTHRMDLIDATTRTQRLSKVVPSLEGNMEFPFTPDGEHLLLYGARDRQLQVISVASKFTE